MAEYECVRHVNCGGGQHDASCPRSKPASDAPTPPDVEARLAQLDERVAKRLSDARDTSLSERYALVAQETRAAYVAALRREAALVTENAALREALARIKTGLCSRIRAGQLTDCVERYPEDPTSWCATCIARIALLAPGGPRTEAE